MKRVNDIKRVFYALAAVLTVACTEGEWTPGLGDGGYLSAYQERQLSRAATPDSYFNTGTRYRIWMYDEAGMTLAGPVGGTGIVGTEARLGGNVPYIELGLPDAIRVINESRAVYGFTDGTPATGQDDPFKPDGDKDCYTVALPSQVTSPEVNADYRDCRRGEWHRQPGEVLGNFVRIPFKHILSQVRLQVMKEPGLTADLQLLSVTLKYQDEVDGLPTRGIYCVRDSKFTVMGRADRLIKPRSTGGDPLAVGYEAADVDTFLTFPTPKEDTGKLLCLSVAYRDPANALGRGEQATVEVPVYDSSSTGEGGTPLSLDGNTSYTLVIMFTSDMTYIVTVIPQVYDWLDGEGDGTHDYQEQDMGQPVTFNGVMWSDRNLGAASGTPIRSIDDWYRSVGYFYQYSRNIPYYPYPKDEGWRQSGRLVDTSKGLKELLQAQVKPPVHPVVQVGTWPDWEGKAITAWMEGEGDVDADAVVWKIGQWSVVPAKTQLFAFARRNAGIADKKEYAKNWDEVPDQPCPPGWRLPTEDDFKGILPPTPIAGNITLRFFPPTEMPGSSGAWNLNGKDLATWYPDIASGNMDNLDPPFDIIFSDTLIARYKVPKANANFSVYPDPADPQHPTSYEEGGQAYTGAFPYIQREEMGDPAEGQKSTYVISMDKDDRVTKSFFGFDQSWGVIYGLKNQGTPGAYRMRWSLHLFESADAVSGNADKYPKGTLRIERFAASASDVLTYRNVKSFDWSHPVAVMYLPVCGLCSSEWGGNKGLLINTGTEVCYATSDRLDNRFCRGLWIKVLGDNSSNKMAALTFIPSGFGVQVRCVRDLTRR